VPPSLTPHSDTGTHSTLYDTTGYLDTLDTGNPPRIPPPRPPDRFSAAWSRRDRAINLPVATRRFADVPPPPIVKIPIPVPDLRAPINAPGPVTQTANAPCAVNIQGNGNQVTNCAPVPRGLRPVPRGGPRTMSVIRRSFFARAGAAATAQGLVLQAQLSRPPPRGACRTRPGLCRACPIPSDLCPRARTSLRANCHDHRSPGSYRWLRTPRRWDG